MRWYRPASIPRSSPAAHSRSSTGTAAATGPARRRRSTRISGSGTRASSRSGSRESTPTARRRRAASAVPRAMDERHAPAHALRRRTSPTWAARGSGSRDGTRSRRDDIDDLVHHAAPGHRHRRVDGRARRCRPTTRSAFLAEAFPSSSPITSGSTASAIPTARPGHADPPVGVRARHHAAVDAGARAHARRRGGRVRQPACTWRTSCDSCGGTRSTCRRCSGRPTTRASGMLVLARLARALRLRAAPHAARSIGADPGPRVQLDPRGRQPIVALDRRRNRRSRCRRSWLRSLRAHDGRASKSCGTSTPASTSRATRRPASSSGSRRSRPSCRCSRGVPHPNARAA